MGRNSAIGSIAVGTLVVLLLGVAPGSRGDDVPIVIDTLIPYANRDEIRDSIRENCGLGTRLSRLIVEQAGSRDLDLERVGNFAELSPSRILKVRITDALTGLGGAQSAATISIDGVLKEDNKVVGTFVATRFADAGLLSIAKDECKVFAAPVDELAEDVAKWLAAPTLDARLGEAR